MVRASGSSVVVDKGAQALKAIQHMPSNRCVKGAPEDENGIACCAMVQYS